MGWLNLLAPVFLHLFNNYLSNKAEDARGLQLYYELVKYMGEKSILKTKQRESALEKMERIKKKWAEEAQRGNA